MEEELHVEQQVPQLEKEQAKVEGMEMEKQNDVQEQSICNIQSYSNLAYQINKKIKHTR